MEANPNFKHLTDEQKDFLEFVLDNPHLMDDDKGMLDNDGSYLITIDAIETVINEGRYVAAGDYILNKLVKRYSTQYKEHLRIKNYHKKELGKRFNQLINEVDAWHG